MRSAAEVMKEELAQVEFQDPEPPYLSSITCDYESASGLPDLLLRQIVSPVRWRQAVEKLAADGADRYLEVGNGKVLCGLIRGINRDAVTAGTSDPRGLEKALAALRPHQG